VSGAAADGGTTWRLPRLPERDPALARRLAADARWLADALAAAGRQADGAVAHAQRT
jgi:hypothetical protein